MPLAKTIWCRSNRRCTYDTRRRPSAMRRPGRRRASWPARASRGPCGVSIARQCWRETTRSVAAPSAPRDSTTGRSQGLAARSAAPNSLRNTRMTGCGPASRVRTRSPGSSRSTSRRPYWVSTRVPAAKQGTPPVFRNKWGFIVQHGTLLIVPSKCPVTWSATPCGRSGLGHGRGAWARPIAGRG